MLSSEVASRCLGWLAESGHAALPSTELLTGGPLASLVVSSIDPLDRDGGRPQQVASVQRCLRPDDMGLVGRTGHHGTFFQMVTAIAAGADMTADLARATWALTTGPVAAGGLGISTERLHVEVASEDVARFWTSAVGLDASRLARTQSAAQVATRPGDAAAFRSDIVLDRGGHHDGPAQQDRPDSRSLPLWTLHSSADGTMSAIGIGVERVAMAVQLVATFSDTDQVRPVLDRIADLTGTPYDGSDPGSVAGVRLRVAADHVRSALMLADAGVTASDGELGPVMARVVRRTAHALRLLGFDQPALAELLPIARDLMAPAYPSVAEQYDRIEAVLVDMDADVRGTRSWRRGRGPAAESAATPRLAVLDALRNASGSTDSLAYETLQATVNVVAILRDEQSVDVSTAGTTVDVVLDCTPFFAQRCGQASDRGTLYAEGVAATVTDVRWAIPGLVVHRVHVDAGELRVAADLTAEVDAVRRLASCQAHSATHVLQAALRDELGQRAVRLTSADEPGRLMVELDGTLPWSDDIAAVVEDTANDALRRDLTVSASMMRLDEARLGGALDDHSSPGTDMVRVIEIDGDWSREMCDGTHVLRTSQIGLITFVDSGVTEAGRLRIEALCGLDGLRRLTRDRDLVRRLTATARVTREQLLTLIDSMGPAELASRVADVAPLDMPADTEPEPDVDMDIDTDTDTEPESDVKMDIEPELDTAEAEADAAAAAATWLAGAVYAEAHTPHTGQARDLAELVCDRLDPTQPGVVLVTGGDGNLRSVVVVVNSPGVIAGLSAHELIRTGLDCAGEGVAELAEDLIDVDDQRGAIAGIRMKIGVVIGSLPSDVVPPVGLEPTLDPF